MESDKRLLGEKIADWLDKEGYPLEFDVAVKFHLQAFEVQTGVMIATGDGTPRDVDVLADSTFSLVGERPLRKFRVLCECKKSEQPWILMRAFTQRGGIFEVLGLPRTSGLRALDHMLFEREKALIDTILFSPKVPTGHGLVQAFGRGKQEHGNAGRDIPYDALRKVCSLACDYIQMVDASSVADVAMLMVIPMIVTSSPLFTTKFDIHSSKIGVEPIEFGRVRWGFGKQSATAIIVQSNALSNVVKQLSDELLLFGREINAVFQSSSERNATEKKRGA